MQEEQEMAAPLTAAETPQLFDSRHRQPREIQGIHIKEESLRVSTMLSAFEDLPPAAQIYIAVIDGSCNWETQTRLLTY